MTPISVLRHLAFTCRRWWTAYRLRCAMLDLASAREWLEQAEADLCRQLPPEIHCDVQAEVVELRHRVAALEARREGLVALQAQLMAAIRTATTPLSTVV